MGIEEIRNKIIAAGGNIYLVGGAVRDELLGKKVKDRDYCVTGISDKEFITLFPKAKMQGKSFGVYSIENVEIALARKETKIGEGHKNFSITTEKNITIEEDLKRRDITINAIAKNLETEELIDPFSGIKDLKERIIRATSEHFVEDPLRVYRVARFAAELKFEIEEETIQKMKQLKKELNTLSVERVVQELKRALDSNKPSIFFEVLKNADVLDVHFQEIYQLVGVLQPEEFHPEGDAYKHTMLVLDKAATLTDKTEFRFAALVHDLGKGLTPRSEYPHHYGHEQKGIKPLEKMGERLKLPKIWIECGKTACLEHMRGGIFYRMNPSKKVSFIERVSHTKLGLEGLQIVVFADKLSSRDEKKENIQFSKIGYACMSEINGKYIMKKYNLKQGKQVAEKLHQERIDWIKAHI